MQLCLLGEGGEVSERAGSRVFSAATLVRRRWDGWCLENKARVDVVSSSCGRNLLRRGFRSQTPVISMLKCP